MHGANNPGQIKQLPDLDALDVQSLKALVLTQQAELDSRTTEIESLKLLILKLKRMHFGPRSEKYSHDIQQLELRLEDLEANQAAAEPPPVVPAMVALKQEAPRKHCAASVAGRTAARDRNDRAGTRSVPRLRRQVAPPGRRCIGNAGVCDGTLQSDPHRAAETQLRELFANRASAGAESAD